jgi:hypothetical protein
VGVADEIISRVIFRIDIYLAHQPFLPERAEAPDGRATGSPGGAW